MLDFYLLGIARSGTSALCNAINLHPEVYCGMERFMITQDPRTISFPDSFLDTSLSGNPKGVQQAIDCLVGMNTAKVSSMIVGDKLPRKFSAPSHLRYIKSAVCVYRPYELVCNSWDTRANNTKDHTWARARTGYLLFFDLLYFFSIASQLKRVAWIDYNQLFYKDYKAELDAAFIALGVTPDSYPHEQFVEKLYRKLKPKTGLQIDQRYHDFARSINLPEFEEGYFSARPADRLTLVREYGDYIRSKRIDFVSNFLNSLSSSEFAGLKFLFPIISKTMTRDEQNEYFPDSIKSKLVSLG